jgi:signal transduction histidine kinase
MNALILFYAALYALAAAIALALVVMCWRRRAISGSRSLAGLLLALAVWSGAELLELLAVGPGAKIMWSKFSYLGAATCPTLLLVFAVEYTQRKKYLAPRFVLLRWLVPLITLALVFTNDWHGWVWDRITPIPSDLELLSYGHGGWFWVNALYSYGVVLLAMFMVATTAARASIVYRGQAFALLISIGIPLFANAIYVLEYSPMEGLDISPFAFILSGCLLAFGIFRLRLLDLVPVARDLLLAELDDGVIVLDERGRIADINPAAQAMLHTEMAAIGQQIPDLPGPRGEFQVEGRWFDRRISELRDPHGATTGRLIVLHDLTERKQAEMALEENAILRERQRLARDLHDSVTQSLNSLVLSAYTATNRLKQGHLDRLESSISQMATSARQALKEMRLLLYDLRLAPAGQMNLADALRTRLEAVESRSGIDAQFTVEEVGPLDASVEHELYMIAMEALNNSIKHSNATRVVVSLRRGSNGLELEMMDNGSGFSARTSHAGGMGLTSMSERASKIGGELTITSAPGEGTRILMRVKEGG